MKRLSWLLGLVLMLMLAMSVGAQKSTDGATVLEGQVVCCLDCWAEQDRTKVEYGTAEDLLSAKTCIENGDPTLIAVREGEKFVFYELREGRFKLDGENWHEFVGSKIRITGEVKKSGKRSSIKVDELEVIVLSIAEREARDVIGRVVELKLNGLYGTGQDLAQFKGRIVILNFWATYCPPCVEEMPDLGEIQNEFGAFGVQVIGASADEPGDRSKVLKFIQETKVNFPIWLGADSSDMRRFGLGEALPGTVIIDRDGKVSRVISGVIDKEDIRKEIRTMLNAAASGFPEEDVPESTRPPVAEKAKRVSSVPS